MINHFRVATEADCQTLALKLRDADVAEIKAGTGLPPLPVLVASYRAGHTFVGLHPETASPEIMFGVVPVIGTSDVGTVWLLGSDAILDHRTLFLRCSLEGLKLLHGLGYPMLTNLVDERNTVHIKWLRWLGFSFIRRVSPWGAEARPFLQFARLDPNV